MGYSEKKVNKSNFLAKNLSYLISNTFQEALSVPETLSGETDSLPGARAGEADHVLLQARVFRRERLHFTKF